MHFSLYHCSLIFQPLLPPASRRQPVASGSSPCGEEEGEQAHHLPSTHVPDVATEPTYMTTNCSLSSDSISKQTDDVKTADESWTIVEVENEQTSSSQPVESLNTKTFISPVKTMPHRTKSNKLPKPTAAVSPIKRSPSESNIRKRNSTREDDSVFCNSTSSRNLHETHSSISREAYSDVNLTETYPDMDASSPCADSKDSEPSIFRKMSSSLKAITSKVKGNWLDVAHDPRKYRPPRRFGDVGKVDVIDLTKENESSYKRHMSRSEIFKGLFVGML